MRRNWFVLTLLSVLGIVLAMSFLKSNSFAQETAAQPKILADGTGAKSEKVENMHEVRYIEMFLAFPDAKTKSLVAACYNTMFTPNGIPASRDTAPQNLVAGLDMAKIKEEYGVLGASLNGPKLWMPDWAEADAGVERDFNGMPAIWVGQLNMGNNAKGVEATKPYTAETIARKSSLGWNKGTRVLLLDDDKGNTWIMKGFQVGLKPQYAYKEFMDSAASRFKELPPGWKVRVVVLEKDYVETPANGVATIAADEFFNVYDKTGPGMGNYKP